jgi:hypothetical protein
MKHTPGYIAITTSILLSLSLMVVGITLAFTSFFSRSNTLAASSKARSVYAAHSCLEQALLSYSLDSSYAGNQSITVDAGPPSVTCAIQPLTTQGSNKIIRVQSIVSRATTNLILTIDSTSMARVSLQEVPTL